MKEILKNIGTHTLLCVLSFTSVGVIYAAWNDDVISGSALTADSWNNLVTQVEGITTGSGKFISGTDTNDAVFSSGSVGIGTNEPETKLTLHDGRYYQVTNTDTNHSLALKNTVSNTGWQMYHLNSTDVTSNGFLIESFDGTSYTRRFTIDQSGNVGIGTNSPSAKLQVTDAGASIGITPEYNGESYIQAFDGPGDFRKLNIHGDGVAIHSHTLTAKPITFTGANVGIETTSPDEKLVVNGNLKLKAYSKIYFGNTSDRVSIHSPSTDIMSLTTGGVEAIRINSGGNVGIGTSSPGAKLHVAIEDNESVIFGNNDGISSNFRLLNKYGNGFNYLQVGIDPLDANANLMISRMGTTNSIANFHVLSLSSYFSGNVGIGTTAPTQSLSVAGNANKSSGGTSWAAWSDRRLKDESSFRNYEYGLDAVIQLQPKYFRYKENNELGVVAGEKDEIGFIAQEVQSIIPDAIVETKSGYLELQADPIHWATINAIKELKAQNDELRERITQLESH